MVQVKCTPRSKLQCNLNNPGLVLVPSVFEHCTTTLTMVYNQPMLTLFADHCLFSIPAFIGLCLCLKWYLQCLLFCTALLLFNSIFSPTPELGSPATESPSHPVQSSSAVSKPLSSPPTMMSTTSPTSSSPSPSSQSISVSKSSTHSIATESSSQTSSIQSPSATESSSQTSSIQSPSATESSSQTSSIQSPSATESSSQTFSIQSPSATESTSQQTSTFSTMMSTTSPTSSLASTTSISPTMSPTEPPVLDTPTVSHNELNLFPGTNDSVTCTSNIPATLVWSFDDGAMLPSNVNFYQINETSAVLEITNFDSETHQGLYRCVATAGGQEKGVIVLINPRSEHLFD